MKQKNRVPLFVEPLEDRWVPATVRLVSGSLLISNPLVTGGSASITLTATGPNQFKVQDGASNLGTYNVGGNIYFTGSNAKDVMTVNLAGNTYAGNLFINGQNGNDTINVTSSAAGGVIGGNVTILPGLGNDQVGVASLNANGITVGGTLQVINTLGNDSFTLGNGTSSTTVGGDVTITGDSSVTIGAGKRDTIGGNLTINSTLTNVGTNITLGTAGSGILVNKNFYVTSGAGNDTVTALGADTFNGNVNINLGSVAGASAGSVSFAAGGMISGNLNVQSGAASTTFNTVPSTTALLTVQGNAAFNLGDGNNSFLPTGDLAVQGNLNVTEGNGNDTLNFGTITGTTSNSSINGNLVVNLGNGTDSTGVNALVGGTVIYRSGNGLPGDILQIGGVTGAVGGNNYNLNVQFGNGDDTFTLATNGLVSGTVDGGGRVQLNGIGNVFNQTAPAGTDTATLSPFFTLSNFP